MPTFNVLNSQNRQAGRTNTSSADITALPWTNLSARVLLQSADLGDTTLTLTLGIEGSDDDATWTLRAETNWRGGPQVVNRLGATISVEPTISWGADQNRPTHLRGYVITSRTLRYGVEVTVT